MPDFFPKMIRHLRQHEEVLLYSHLFETTESERQAVVDFLAEEYALESVHYPQPVPPFDAHTALWAAHVVYAAAQFIIYREHDIKEMERMLPDQPSAFTASNMLSADLCLRFVPDLLRQVELIDQEDRLGIILKEYLQKWPYSGIGYPIATNHQLQLMPILVNTTSLRMFVDRIIAHRQLKLAQHPAFAPHVRANLGAHGALLWPEFDRTPVLNT